MVCGLPQLVVADVRFAADAEHAEEEQGKDNLHAEKATWPRRECPGSSTAQWRILRLLTCSTWGVVSQGQCGKFKP